MSTFIAKYSSTCPDCENKIDNGDEVTYNGSNQIVHATCPDDISSGTSNGYCPNCFTALPKSNICGVCD